MTIARQGPYPKLGQRGSPPQRPAARPRGDSQPTAPRGDTRPTVRAPAAVRAEGAIRRQLSGCSRAQVEAACAEGFDGMSKLVTRVLGEEAWLRMVSNAPAAWEEGDALRHMSDVLRRPEP